jgi:hypothetical protein
MAVFCVPHVIEVDEETGCRFVSCGDNAYQDYQSCKQTYYMKKQAEAPSTATTTIVVEKTEAATDTELQELRNEIKETKQDIAQVQQGTFFIAGAIILSLAALSLVLLIKIWKKKK